MLKYTTLEPQSENFLMTQIFRFHYTKRLCYTYVPTRLVMVWQIFCIKSLQFPDQLFIEDYINSLSLYVFLIFTI